MKNNIDSIFIYFFVQISRNYEMLHVWRNRYFLDIIYSKRNRSISILFLVACYESSYENRVC